MRSKTILFICLFSVLSFSLISCITTQHDMSPKKVTLLCTTEEGEVTQFSMLKPLWVTLLCRVLNLMVTASL